MKYYQKIIVPTIIALFILFVGIYSMKPSTNDDAPIQNPPETVNKVSLALEEEGAKIPLSNLQSGCPRQDCIPSIDNPVFESISDGDTWLDNSDLVFIYTLDNLTKIYPQRIMNWHEIVNDWYGETPIAITFCPLCGTATAFERIVNGTTTQFGVSGKLHNSDLIMYDRLEGSLWQQVTGEAIIGPAARNDEILQPLFLVTIPWEKAKQNYPDATVLSQKTGHIRNYNQYPYQTYESDGDIYFGVENSDDRLHPKEWVYGVKVNGITKAYPEKAINDSFTDKIGDTEISISYDNGIISFTNNKTQEEIIPLRSFWFAWAAFNPETILYQGSI